MEADGGSRGNPGPAGYGAVVRDADTGEVLAERAASLGRATNNVAEYNGLLAGLRAAASLDPESVEVRMDSKLVVEQMSGRWRVKHPDLQPLHAEGRRLASALPAVTFGWIPRERNSYADRLANEAMDAAAAGREWSSSLDPAGASASGAQAAPANADDGWLADDDRPTRLILVRHGSTELSGLRYSGRVDPELNAHGQAQARALAARLAALKADEPAVVSSPLRRAVATAAPIAEALGTTVETDDGLLELDFGQWEGRTFDEVKRGWRAERAAFRTDPSAAPPGGESVDQVNRRVRRARDRIIAAHPGGTVVVVSHVTPIKVLLCAALAAPTSSVFRLHLNTASVSTVDWYPDRVPLVRLVNDISHL
ncbi:MAG TPA: bifunctional RNase H/acid phosphatase [Mycobacteriales bacterium]|nr:bifunctional RNase H/acid phosphatase [Mycobacteriales bacterium]